MKNDAPVVALVTYESPRFAGGGIAPVVRALTEILGKSENVVVVTPLHSEMPGAEYVRGNSQRARTTEESEVLVRKDGGATYFYVSDRQGVAFRGKPHPYSLPHKDLVRDAVLFGKWAAEILNGMRVRLVLLNDWQAAAVTLWVDSPATLVLHNGYDSAGLADGDLRKLGCPQWQSPDDLREATVLERAIPRVASICAVSDGFARELSQPGIEPATDCLGPQITRALRGRTVAAVPNAPFLAPPELAYAEALRLASTDQLHQELLERTANRLQALRAADRGRAEPLLHFKADRAERLKKTLTCAGDVTVWGDVASFVDSREPLIVIGGRCDFRIKGHDVAAAVAASRSARRQRGRWLFLLIPQSQASDVHLKKR